MNTLVIYFSQTGTTKAVAENIAAIKNAELMELKPQKPYNMSYWKTIAVSLKEKFTKARPPLAMEIPDIQKYSQILVGCPIWCGFVPNVILTLLDAADLNEKHMALFTTSGATKPDKTAAELNKMYPEAKWHQPLHANGATEETIRNWMQQKP